MGYGKDIVFVTPVRNACDLCHRIMQAIISFRPDMMINTWIEIELSFSSGTLREPPVINPVTLSLNLLDLQQV